MIKRLLLAAFMLALAGTSTAFELVDSRGKHHKLSQYKGKWVLVNYWATWCPPCLEEIPDLQALHNNARNNLVVLGVAMEYQNPNQVLDFAKRLRITYPVILGEGQSTEQIGPVRGLPTTYLFDPAGKQVAYNVGLLTREAVENYIADKKKPTK